MAGIMEFIFKKSIVDDDEYDLALTLLRKMRLIEKTNPSYSEFTTILKQTINEYENRLCNSLH